MNEPMTQKQRIVAHLEAYGPLPRADLIVGDGADALAAIRAVSSALEAHGSTAE